MKSFVPWTLAALVLTCGLSSTVVRAEEEEESVCAAETIDGMLDKAVALVKANKGDDVIANCFTPDAAKKAAATPDDLKMLKAMFATPEVTKMLEACKGHTTIAADGKTAKCADPKNPQASGSFEMFEEEWYLSM